MSMREPSGVQATDHMTPAGPDDDPSSGGSVTRPTTSWDRVSTIAVPKVWVTAARVRSGLTETEEPNRAPSAVRPTKTRSISRPLRGSMKTRATLPLPGSPEAGGVLAGATTTRPGSTTWKRLEIHRSPRLP